MTFSLLLPIYRSGKTIWRATLLTVFVLAWGTDASQALRNTPALSSMHATAVPGTRGGSLFGETELASGESEYVWLSDQALLVWQHKADHTGYDIFRLDRHTGRRIPMTALQAKLKRAMDVKSQDMIYSRDVSPSPDGQYVVWFKGGHVGPARQWVLASLDGKMVSTGQIKFPTGPAIWTPDSKGWLLFGASVFDGNGGIWFAHYRLGGTSRLHYTGNGSIKLPCRDVPIAYLHSIGLKPDGAFLTVLEDRPQNGSAVLVRINWNRTTRPPVITRISLPGHGRWLEIIASPSGDRLTWLIYCPNGTPQEPSPSVQLWVSRFDGTALQRIGGVPVQRLQEGALFGDDFPSSVRWLPSGRELSFAYQGALYTVPVQKGP